ncbi:MAG: DNA-processing protein DprA [Pseudomonadota bacterium]
MREWLKIANGPGGLSDAEKRNWLRLARTPRVGPVTFFQLLHRFGSASAALEALPSLSKRSGSLAIPDPGAMDKEWQAIAAYGAQLICSAESDYPAMLKQDPPPPPVLTALGDLKLLQRRCVAIVGARQASAAGRKLARGLAHDLSSAGFVIASGLARGIDGEAHAASLEGGTVAVLGGGIDHIYPPQHERLYAQIAEKGLLLSESAYGHRATARDFPRRNRIITGIAEGVVVIEAAERSGSLISARTAAEQNREVMAVPGSPLDPRAAGNNKLLRQGATLVRHADDVIEALSGVENRWVQAPEPPEYESKAFQHEDLPDHQIQAVLIALGPVPTQIEDLARAADISVPRCAAILVELELSGQAITYPGGLAALAV